MAFPFSLEPSLSLHPYLPFLASYQFSLKMSKIIIPLTILQRLRAFLVLFKGVCLWFSANVASPQNDLSSQTRVASLIHTPSCLTHYHISSTRKAPGAPWVVEWMNERVREWRCDLPRDPSPLPMVCDKHLSINQPGPHGGEVEMEAKKDSHTLFCDHAHGGDAHERWEGCAFAVETKERMRTAGAKRWEAESEQRTHQAWHPAAPEAQP